MPSDRQFRLMSSAHRLLVKASRGRIGRKVSGMPVLELTTTGRKTGEPHPVLLTTPLQEDDVLVVVATKMGHDHHPAWFLNLQDKPDAEVVFPFPAEPARPIRARVADPEERGQLWPRIVEIYHGYAKYQAKTERELPVVLLEPAP